MSLPVETWVEVFRFAICIPPALDPLPNDPEHPKPEDRICTYDEEAYGSALRQKALLSRVSKTWMDLVLPLLYEDIRLRLGGGSTGCSISKQLVEFTHKRCGDRYTARAVGWYTRRFDIDGDFMIGNVDYEGHEETLFHFLETCPKLSGFCINGNLISLPLKALERLSSILSKTSLRFFQFGHTGWIDEPPLHLFPALKSLVIPFRTLGTLAESRSLPSITSLTLDTNGNGEQMKHIFPNLDRLSLVDLRPERTFIEVDLLSQFLPFAQRSCKVLRSLRISLRYDQAYHNSERLDALLPLLQFAPNLEELVLDEDYTYDIVTRLKSEHAVFLRIKTIKLLAWRQLHYPTLSYLPALDESFPGLATLCYSCELRNWMLAPPMDRLRRVAAKGVVVHDSRGVLPLEIGAKTRMLEQLEMEASSAEI